MAILIITLWSSDSCIYTMYLYPTYILYFIVFLHACYSQTKTILFRMHGHAEYMHVILYSVTVHDCIHILVHSILRLMLQYLFIGACTDDLHGIPMRNKV